MLKTNLYERVRPALVVAQREVRDQLRDWRIIFPVFGLTVFFPFLMNFTAQQILGFVRQYGASILGERLVPFLLMIVGFFPISVSLVIALESFVGEKERGSIEPLLDAPLYDWQLYLGKLLSSTVPPLLSSYIGMGVYLGGLLVSGIPLPSFDMLAQIILLTTVQAVMMVAGAVVVSSQATSVRAANLLASFIIIPVALLIQGESVVMFWDREAHTLWWAVFGLAVLTILLVRVGLAHFQREELLGREIDVLNLRWGWGVFVRSFSGGERSLSGWYRRTIPRALAGLRVEVLIMSALAVAGFMIGWQQINFFNVPLDSTSLDGIDDRLRGMLGLWGNFSLLPVGLIFWQNLRVMLVAMAAGAISLGILGGLPLMASTGVAGYLFALLLENGISPLAYVAFVLPHGIVEIPAAIIAAAAVLKTGALLATPVPGKTIGEVFINGLANWLKLMLGVVIPLLLLGACIEVWLTPRIALMFF